MGLFFAIFGSGSSRHRTGHAQEPAETDPSTAHRPAAHGIVREARQEARDRDGPFQPRQRHARALMRAGGEGEVAVRRARDVEAFGVWKLRGCQLPPL